DAVLRQHDAGIGIVVFAHESIDAIGELPDVRPQILSDRRGGVGERRSQRQRRHCCCFDRHVGVPPCWHGQSSAALSHESLAVPGGRSSTLAVAAAWFHRPSQATILRLLHLASSRAAVRVTISFEFHSKALAFSLSWLSGWPCPC